MSNRFDACFAALKKKNRAALVTFITAGDPDLETGYQLMQALPAAGADIIELGVPFSDPMADGPAIQLAGRRALAQGAHLGAVLDMVVRFRKTNQTTPVVLMGYYNPIYIYGVEKFARDAEAAGVDGLIVVDLPPEESIELRAHLKKTVFVPLATPTTSPQRLEKILDGAGGFVYYVSVMGVTGTASASHEQLQAAMDRLRSHAGLPVAIGFGISSPEQAAEAACLADGVVVGSALVRRVAEKLNSDNSAQPGLVAHVCEAVSDLARAISTARG